MSVKHIGSKSVVLSAGGEPTVEAAKPRLTAEQRHADQVARRTLKNLEKAAVSPPTWGLDKVDPHITYEEVDGILDAAQQVENQVWAKKQVNHWANRELAKHHHMGKYGDSVFEKGDALQHLRGYTMGLADGRPVPAAVPLSTASLGSPDDVAFQSSGLNDDGTYSNQGVQFLSMGGAPPNPGARFHVNEWNTSTSNLLQPSTNVLHDTDLGASVRLWEGPNGNHVAVFGDELAGYTYELSNVGVAPPLNKKIGGKTVMLEQNRRQNPIPITPTTAFSFDFRVKEASGASTQALASFGFFRKRSDGSGYENIGFQGVIGNIGKAEDWGAAQGSTPGEIDRYLNTALIKGRADMPRNLVFEPRLDGTTHDVIHDHSWLHGELNLFENLKAAIQKDYGDPSLNFEGKDFQGAALDEYVKSFMMNSFNISTELDVGGRAKLQVRNLAFSDPASPGIGDLPWDQ